jgi:hypothetical protein
MRLFKAIKTGLVDGFEQPYELTMGMTWEDSDTLNRAYDHSVNVGQSVGAFLVALSEAKKSFLANVQPQQ